MGFSFHIFFGHDDYKYTIANLKPVTTYNVQLRANNSAGWGDYTELANKTTGEQSHYQILFD